MSALRGAVVRSLPRTFATVRIGGKVYYRAGDTYYIRAKKGYRVVASPYKNRRSFL